MVQGSRSGRGRGRPKIHSAEPDLGTQEARVHRLLLSAGADPVQSEHPLGALLARQLIDPLQHEAGCFYAHLYRCAVRRPLPSVTWHYQRLLTDPAGQPRPANEPLELRNEALFREGKNRLLAAGRWVCNATENVAVFQVYPPFLMEGSASAARNVKRSTLLQAIMLGLDTLAACYGRGPRGNGAMARHRAPSLGPGPARRRSRPDR